jgi:methyltransferase (TIGR00027 family)
MGSQSLSKLGHTALEVALVRARESERPDRLFDDPYAAAFAAELAPEAAAGGTAQAQEALAFQVAIRTRFFDDFLLEACDQGCRQVVLLAAGLDTRAFRLDWPDGVRLFELDLPDVIEAKDAVLAAQGATARCERHALAIDLREDWPAALRAAGFDPAQPTAWLAEGLLIYLGAEEAAELLQAVGDLAAPGSWLAAERANFADPALLEQARAQLGMDHFSALWKGGLGYDAADWLPAHGWEVHADDVGFVAAAYGRPTDSDAGGGFLTASYTGESSRT